MTYTNISLSPYRGNLNRRFTVTLWDRDTKKGRTRHIGRKRERSYIDPEVGPMEREEYIERHFKNIEECDPFSSRALTMHLLWGDTKSLTTNYHQYKKNHLKIKEDNNLKTSYKDSPLNPKGKV